MIFLLLAFGLGWALVVPVYGFGVEGAPALLLLGLGGLAPSAAALLVTRGAVWRETWRGPRPAWALGAGLVGPSFLSVVAGFVAGGPTFGPPNLPGLVVPPLGEELGWRGYLLRRWRSRLGALGASAAVGAIWALWHLPSAWGRLGEFPEYFVGVTAGGVVMGWLWERSRGSNLAAIALHAGMNLGVVRAGEGAMAPAWVAAALLAAVALARADREPAWVDGEEQAGP